MILVWTIKNRDTIAMDKKRGRNLNEAAEYAF